MELSCPDCGHSIPPQHINVITDLAQCPACGALHRLSSLAPAPGVPAAVRQEPPPGSALQLSRGLDGVEVHLPRRRAGCGTFFFMGFALFWLSFVAVWTVLAASASGFFALFSILFWLIGGGLLLAAVNFMTENANGTGYPQPATHRQKAAPVFEAPFLRSPRHPGDPPRGAAQQAAFFAATG
ncbi:hypothetical protein [Flaviaesturariibacter aridisoli]|uniref:Uncharacterized protein n=1 Tax=Flaviaesturariibacter aridisoli TaxID=2545761 RepID=A0A4R4E0C9_9BACT|nr:hypothetical protein [Flaviaesturariibacter aridisoli]TCZ68646.1 hypothetical protein E0486_13595 [Flaviaesturariibacter aridisoli]